MSEVLNKYLDLEGLKKYDVLIKNFIAKGNTDLANVIAALDAKLGSLDVEGSDDKSIAESIVDIYASIADIIDAQESLEAKDNELAIQIKKVADDLDFITGSSSDNEATLGEINATLTAMQEELAVVKESLNDVVGVAAEAKAAVDVLVGEGDGSVKKIAETAAAEAVAAVVADADSDFDTLKEVAEWIAADTLGSAALQVNVAKNTEDITKLDAKVDVDIKNLSDHITDAAAALEEVDSRLDALENASIDIEDIVKLFEE
jgi:chromosome segregation ATPase